MQTHTLQRIFHRFLRLLPATQNLHPTARHLLPIAHSHSHSPQAAAGRRPLISLPSSASSACGAAQVPAFRQSPVARRLKSYLTRLRRRSSSDPSDPVGSVSFKWGRRREEPATRRPPRGSGRRTLYKFPAPGTLPRSHNTTQPNPTQEQQPPSSSRSRCARYLAWHSIRGEQ